MDIMAVVMAEVKKWCCSGVVARKMMIG